MTLRPDDPTLMLSGDGDDPEGALPSSPSLVDQKIVEAAIRRGLISAVQATSVLESLSGTPPGGNPLAASSSTSSSLALQDLIARGLVSTAVAAELEEEVKNDFVPGYTLEGELGRGGMGVVYRARQRRLDRAVALKVVNPGAAHEPDYLRRFKQEALALAKLNHPHIVQVYDYGETAGKVYLALELVEGHDAMAALKEGPMSEAQALRVVRDAALGLGHAHAAGVIHRDVKPHNLMLVARSKPGPDDRWVAKVTDLGLARQATRGADEAQSTKEGVILGSPAYMSPEQADGQPADFRSDIYALGATLYHLVTGTPPYQAESAIKVIVKKQTERLDDPRALAPRLTEATVRVLDRCMARPRDDRYPSYEALVEDLERVLRGEAPLTPVVPEHASSLQLAPARPGTARLLPPSGAARPSEAPGGSGMIAAAVIAGVVVVSGAISIALAVYRHPGAFGGDPAPTTESDVAAPSPAARVAAALDALAGLSPGDVLAPARLRGVREQVEALPEADRPPLALQLASVVGKALDATAEARVAALEATLERGDYARLATAVDDAVAPYGLIEREVPARLRELQDLARQAAGPEGEAERAAWAAARAVSDPLAVIAALEGFEARFPWSPARDEARARLAEATARAPEVTLVASPADARVVLDGQALPPGGWTGRLLVGRHEVSAEAPGHYVLERALDVQAPGTITLRLNPQPARPLVEDKEREYPAWIASRPLLEQWTLESGHFVAAPELSALRGEGREGGGWSIATRDLAPSLKRVRAPATGPWRLTWHVVAPPEEGGAAEVRLLAAPDGRTAVVGARDGALYLGLRGPDGEPLEVLARQPLGELVQGAAVLAADWDGAVLVVYQRGDLVGSAVLPWEAAATHVQVAVQGSTAEFRSMLVRPLIESGAR